MAYSWDNRVKFVVRYMYDIDGNGSLDKNDFECLAVRNTVIEGKGDFDQATFKKNQEVMANLWNEIAELADFNKDSESLRERMLTIEQQLKQLQQSLTSSSISSSTEHEVILVREAEPSNTANSIDSENCKEENHSSKDWVCVAIYDPSSKSLHLGKKLFHQQSGCIPKKKLIQEKNTK